MKTKETDIMIHFLHRPSMYLGKINMETIKSFMNGAAFGKIEGPHWTSLLSDFLVHEYSITKPAAGWSYQVNVYAEKNKIEWVDAFKDAMLKMIEKSDLIAYTTELEKMNNKYKKQLTKPKQH